MTSKGPPAASNDRKDDGSNNRKDDDSKSASTISSYCNDRPISLKELLGSKLAKEFFTGISLDLNSRSLQLCVLSLELVSDRPEILSY